MSNRVALVALLLTATPAVAGNLLSNPTFDTDLSGWAYVGPANWDPSDALAQATSGSMAGTNNASGPFTYQWLLISACLPVTAGAAYDASMDFLIPTGQGVTANPFLEVGWYSQAGCSGLNFLGASNLVDGTTVDGAWHRAKSTYAVTAPANATFASVRVNLTKLEAGGTATAFFDNLVFKPKGTCAVLPDLLCLNNGRFQVAAHFLDYAGQGGAALAQSMTSETGYFWFFSASNVEVVVKVIDACSYNSRYWVYAGGLTDVYVQIVITDTQTDIPRIYTNPLGTPFQPIGDSQAFSTCP